MGWKLGPKGTRQIYHQSGLTFILLTPEQQDALAAALKRLTAAQAAPPPEGAAGTTGEALGESGENAKG